MKTLRFIGIILLTVILCMNFTFCSDDDESNKSITGTTWKCTSTEVTELLDNDEDKINPIEEGRAFKFLSYDRCFFIYSSDEVYPQDNEWTSEDGQYYLWDGSTSELTLIAADFDRWIGTFTIKGDKAIYTYRYENWRNVSDYNEKPQGELTEKELNRYQSIFVRVE